MQKAEGNVGVIGWGTMPDDNEFLEMRVACGGTMVPSGLAALPVGTVGLSLPSCSALHAKAGGSVAPCHIIRVTCYAYLGRILVYGLV